MPTVFTFSFWLLLLTYGYLLRRLVWRIPKPSPGRWLASGILVLSLGAGVSVLFFGDAKSIPSLEPASWWQWSHIWKWMTHISLGFAYVLFGLVVARDVYWGLRQLWQGRIGSPDKQAESEESQPQADLERRRFLLCASNIGLSGISAVATGYGFHSARRLQVFEASVPIPGLPDELVGFTIAQIADLHVGQTIGRDFVQSVVDTVNELSCDLVAFTGDAVNGYLPHMRLRSPPHIRYHLAPLEELRGIHGCYFVTGNHEYYCGAEAWTEEMERLGFTVLLNDHRLLERGGARIVLAGVTDYHGWRYVPSHASSPRDALANAPDGDIRILLAHQPRSVFEASEAGCDLQLSGHTHGGQVFPGHLYVWLKQPYVSGLHRYKNTWIYVSRGTGYVGPVLRLGASAEITRITLCREDRAARPTLASRGAP
ncbi:MAG: metallophosphoesterase [Candidatus Latescibacteria bacterium]|nr:metallophosphoesterase [Candidatus Latescibacterota bacterium]